MTRVHGPGASNNDITSSDISGHGEIVIEHLKMAVWIASCFFFFLITNCVIMMCGVMMLMMFTMCLSSVATNCHRKSEDIRPGAHFSPSSATLRVSRVQSWDLRPTPVSVLQMKNDLLTTVYPGSITSSPQTHHTGEYCQVRGEFLPRCNYFLLSGHPDTSSSCEVMISTRLRLITARFLAALITPTSSRY